MPVLVARSIFAGQRGPTIVDAEKFQDSVRNGKSWGHLAPEPLTRVSFIKNICLLGGPRENKQEGRPCSLESEEKDCCYDWPNLNDFNIWANWHFNKLIIKIVKLYSIDT